MNVIDQSSQPEAKPLLLTTRQAAQALNVSERTLLDLRKLEGLPHLRVGKHLRYSVQALQEWIKQRIVTANSPAVHSASAA